MKATGIVRRIDDLGRIVIPKEIRRQIFGSECTDGKPMELFIDNDSIIFRPYQDETQRKEKEIKNQSIVEFMKELEERYPCFRKGTVLYDNIQKTAEEMKNR